jgi:hypothetical protein
MNRELDRVRGVMIVEGRTTLTYVEHLTQETRMDATTASGFAAIERAKAEPARAVMVPLAWIMFGAFAVIALALIGSRWLDWKVCLGAMFAVPAVVWGFRKPLAALVAKLFEAAIRPGT